MVKELKINEIQKIETEMLRIIDNICVVNGLNYYLVCGSVLGAIRHNGPIPWDYDVDITVPYPELEHFCSVMQEELKDTDYCIYIPGETNVPENITTFPRIALKNVDPRKLHIDVFPQIGISSDKDQQEFLVKRLTKTKTMYRDKRKSKIQPNRNIKSILGSLLLKIKTINYDEDLLLQEFQELCSTYDYKTAEYVTNPCGHYGLKNIVPKKYFGMGKRVPYLDMLLPVPECAEKYLTHYYNDYSQYPDEEVISKRLNYKIHIEVDDE